MLFLSNLSILLSVLTIHANQEEPDENIYEVDRRTEETEIL